ncbi:MAG: hypothetical protein ACOCXQ_00780 [Patescibacteria group bacterium]
MKQIIIGLVVMLFAILVLVPQVQTEEVAGSSATISSDLERENVISDSSYFVRKKIAIKRVLERYNSPLTHTAGSFIDTCIAYDLDCYLLPSISGVESGFGKHIAPGTYNPFGWGGGYTGFSSWEDGYDSVGRGLRENYLNLGATNIYAIGEIYAANPEWGNKVMYFMQEFQDEEERLSLQMDGDQLE